MHNKTIIETLLTMEEEKPSVLISRQAETRRNKSHKKHRQLQWGHTI
jgi:hypothetical protein